MRLQPIIERELRVQARARSTYWLRLLAGLAAVAALGACFLTDDGARLFRRTGHGPWLLALLHCAISVFFAATCALACSDTLAKERREGTLGILLLTPLPPASIVFGKVAVHIIRSFALWLAVVPVLAVPLLLGGVGLVDLTFALLLEMGVVLGGLAAGLIASTVAQQPGRGMALAIFLTVFIGESLALLSFLGLLPSLIAYPNSEYSKHLFFTATFGPWFLGTGLIENGFSGVLARNPAWLRPALFTSLAAIVAGAWGIMGLAVGFAVWRVKRLGRVPGMTERQARRRRFWLRPLAVGWHGRRRRSQLASDPAYWMYTIQPTSGISRWLWCGMGALGWACIWLVGYDERDMAFLVFGIPMALVVAMALGATAAFRRELEDGSIELLLVTPLLPWAIVRGRLFALWRDFLPAIVLSGALAVLWMLINGFVADESTGVLLIVSSSFLAMPVVGMRLAIRRVGPVFSWIMNLVVAGGFPALFALFTAYATEPAVEYGSRPSFAWRYTASFIPFQLAVALICAWCTVTDLATRRFQLRPLERHRRVLAGS